MWSQYFLQIPLSNSHLSRSWLVMSMASLGFDIGCKHHIQVLPWRWKTNETKTIHWTSKSATASCTHKALRYTVTAIHVPRGWIETGKLQTPSLTTLVEKTTRNHPLLPRKSLFDLRVSWKAKNHLPAPPRAWSPLSTCVWANGSENF